MSEWLVALQRRGMDLRNQSDRYPREVIYQLTGHGAAVIPTFDRLDVWAHQFPSRAVPG